MKRLRPEGAQDDMGKTNAKADSSGLKPARNDNLLGRKEKGTGLAVPFLRRRTEPCDVGARPAQTLTGNLQRMVQAHFQDRALVQSDVTLCEKASESASACAYTRANSSTLTATGN